mmetsp:Transcript_27124/g.52800  ORF Transcript_27124/g.52800 Transcript_27124/m.52800 type:complete len:265 (-) Transcript_27124:103-897(-)
MQQRQAQAAAKGGLARTARVHPDRSRRRRLVLLPFIRRGCRRALRLFLCLLYRPPFQLAGACVCGFLEGNFALHGPHPRGDARVDADHDGRATRDRPAAAKALGPLCPHRRPPVLLGPGPALAARAAACQGKGRPVDDDGSPSGGHNDHDAHGAHDAHGTPDVAYTAGASQDGNLAQGAPPTAAQMTRQGPVEPSLLKTLSEGAKRPCIWDLTDSFRGLQASFEGICKPFSEKFFVGGSAPSNSLCWWLLISSKLGTSCVSLQC